MQFKLFEQVPNSKEEPKPKETVERPKSILDELSPETLRELDGYKDPEDMYGKYNNKNK